MTVGGEGANRVNRGGAPGVDGGRELPWGLRLCRRDRVDVVGRAVGVDHAPVGQELTGVVEEDDAVAQQAPSLLRVAGDGVRRLAVERVGGRAVRFVMTHEVRGFPVIWVTVILPRSVGRYTSNMKCETELLWI